MTERRLSFYGPLIAGLALLPSLSGCSDAPPIETPLSDEALAVVADNAGAPSDQLAQQIDDLFTNCLLYTSPSPRD